ncbi:MAG: hypothetical protein Q9162_002811 [Coniocarpon cinnabarinum]
MSHATPEATEFRHPFRIGKLNEGGNAKAVERRKYGTDYLRFIKSAQKFYRSFVRSLNCVFGGIKPLEKLAERFHNDGNATATLCRTPLLITTDLLFSRSTRPSPTNAPPQILILRSCFRSLIQLGDLSRYRESELARGEPNWSPAVGFYDLARFLIPSSGIPYNQLAVIALSGGNLFRAIYWVYRALNVEEPHPQADQNLRRAFAKVNVASQNGVYQGNAPSVQTLYLSLLSHANLGKRNAQYAELERNFSESLRESLKSATSFSSLRKLLLTNFAATQHVQDTFTKTQGAEGSFDVFISTLRLSLMSCTTLLASFREQLRAQVQQHSTTAQIEERAVAQLSVNAALWYLSLLWMVNSKVLLTNDIHEDVDGMRSELWKLATDCISMAFVISSREPILRPDYLLEEEEDTIGFVPLFCDDTKHVWFSDDGHLRPRLNETQSAQDQTKQMLYRFTAIVQLGKTLALDETTPLYFNAQHGFSTSQISDLSELGSMDDNSDEDMADFQAEQMVENLVGDDFNDEPNFKVDRSSVFIQEHPKSNDQSSYAVGSSTRDLMASAEKRVSMREQQIPRSGLHAKTDTSTHRTSLSPRTHDFVSPQGSPNAVNLHPKSLPMARAVSSHSRAISSESVGSFSSGVNLHRSPMAPTSAANDADGQGMSSSLLFGAGQSPWRMTQPESKRLSDSQERLNDSPRLMPRTLVAPTPTNSQNHDGHAWTDSPGHAKQLSRDGSRWNAHANPFK